MNLPNKKEAALYIHIPFCQHKCIYCDFYSIITKDNFDNFLSAVKKEIKYYSLNYSDDHIFKSVFFGGGTPSLMPVKFISDILETLGKCYTISEDAEITLETNPGTVDKKKLIDFRAAGINRLSVGIQSFDEKDLKFLTRIHTKAEALNTIFNAKEAGFGNINLDLIFNLPNQSKGKWLKNMEQAVQLPVTHISAYSLILEQGTILNKMVLDGIVKIEDADYDAELYELTISFLSAHGFNQYEVSNFSKTGCECRHNLAYWQYKNYLGFGPSAHSFVNGKRWWNFSSLKKYISEIEANETAVASMENLSGAESLDEFVMLSLRSKGLDTKIFSSMFGSLWLNKNERYFNKLIGKGLMIKNGCIYSLTSKGYAVCDEIIANIL
jgi:putative oxygen-independent coproporphyrinogen III oxidase